MSEAIVILVYWCYRIFKKKWRKVYYKGVYVCTTNLPHPKNFPPGYTTEEIKCQ